MRLLEIRLATLALALLSACRGAVGEPSGSECPTWQSQALVTCARSANLLHGIDVSKWQGSIDWGRVAGAGVHFAFARVSDGARTRDATFATNFRGMKSAGIVRGAYQFFRPGQDPIEQAELMLSMLEEAGGLTTSDLPPALDLEAEDGIGIEDYRDRAQAWLDHVESGLGRRAIVYTGARFERFTGDAFARYPLWAPHYKLTYSGSCPNIADGWSRWHFWQWTAMGRIDGIPGDVDRNVFDGLPDELSRLIQSSIVGAPMGGWGVSDAGASSPGGDLGSMGFDGGRAADAGVEPTKFPDGAVGTDIGPLPETMGGSMGSAGLESDVASVRSCL